MPSIDIDEFDEKELIPDILAQKPEPENHLGATVIVDGCPVVGPAKYELLKKFIYDKFAKIGPIAECEFPRDDDQMTKGYLFITYESTKAASQALKSLNNSPLDKNHTLQVTPLAEFERAISAPTEWKRPAKQTYVDFGNKKSWLLNEYCRDQFAVAVLDGTTSIYWHSSAEASLIEKRDQWTSAWIHWSPKGTYLATYHPLGALLWGGEKFTRLGRFPHQNVGLLDFSPSEKFIVTRSRSAAPEGQDRPMSDVVLWDVQRISRGREFSIPLDGAPAFKWAPDDTYFAYLRDGYLSVYESANFCLLDKKKIGNGNIRDFTWSPVENVLAYWVPEADNVPARVAVMELPSRKELCSKNLFSVAEIDLCWQKEGNFIATQVLRCAKKKLDNDKQIKYVGTYTNIEVIRMREKLYPVDQIEVKASVACFQWEPSGTRFAFIQTTAQNKSSLSIYDVPFGSSIREVCNIEVPSSRLWKLTWSPKGNLLVVGGLKCPEGWIHFVSANETALIGKSEHPMFNELHWDPTGRYMASVVSSLHQKNDNGVWIWNCIGRLLYKIPFTGLRTFVWRPRPSTLLSKEQLQRLAKSMSKYNRQLAAEDRALTSRTSRELLEKRQRMLSDFTDWRNALTKRFHVEKAERLAAQGMEAEPSDDDHLEEEVLELLTNTSKEVLKKNEYDD